MTPNYCDEHVEDTESAKDENDYDAPSMQQYMMKWWLWAQVNQTMYINFAI